MNEMFEIYKQQNDLYDQLINHEDHEKNLQIRAYDKQSGREHQRIQR